MLLIGILHIILLLTAYIFYIFITLKSFSKNTPYKLLRITNIMYTTGFALGIIWSKIDWGFYLNADIKTIISILLFIPFLAEDIKKTDKYYLPLIGTILIILNYVIPILTYTIHTH